MNVKLLGKCGDVVASAGLRSTPGVKRTSDILLAILPHHPLASSRASPDIAGLMSRVPAVDLPPVRVAYLINQYPQASQTFIRREILALEKLGIAVERFTIRAAEVALVDERDKAAVSYTHLTLPTNREV